MKYINYIFKGFGYENAKYKISNNDIFNAVKKSFLSGFREEKILLSEKYKKYKENNPQATAFEYFVNHIMGFNERYHVSPFPPTRKKLFYSDTALDLCVNAVLKSLLDANVKPDEIDAWFISTVSPHQQAPGIASFLKSYFVGDNNNTPAFTLLSGCAGFSLNLERAIEWLNNHPNAKNVVVAHTETMSSFLTQRIKFVPFVTFGDAAASIVVSKVEDSKKYGVMYIKNYQDQNMLDFVGVDKKKNLYMDDNLIKDRAIINMINSIKECIKDNNISIEDIDYFVPHQTGNAIIYTVTKNFNIPEEKIILFGQHKYGNISGGTIPITLAILNEYKKLSQDSKILCTNAGVGGNYGSFYYIHKQFSKTNDFYLYENDLKNKNCLILGASGFIGKKVAIEINKRGGNLILHYNQNHQKLDIFNNSIKIKADFTVFEDIKKFINTILDIKTSIDHVYILTNNIEKEKLWKVNYLAAVEILKNLLPIIKSTVITVGNSCEDFSSENNLHEWVASKRAIHGFIASSSGEFLKNGIKTIYIQAGFTENGLFLKLPEKYIFKTMLLSGQDDCIKSDSFVNKIVNSSYVHKVSEFKYSYENAMLLARYGYYLDVDV